MAALLAVAISYIAVAVVVPTLAALLIQPETETIPDITRSTIPAASACCSA